MIASSTGYSGQKCSACSRAIVHTAVYDLFSSGFKRLSPVCRWAIRNIPVHRLGPVIDERAQASILDYIKIGNQEGRVMVEGRVTQPGWYVGPTVFADVASTARIAQKNLRTGPSRPEGQLI